jgi:hypothetical protein
MPPFDRNVSADPSHLDALPSPPYYPTRKTSAANTGHRAI